MKELLISNYHIYAKELIHVDGREGFRDNEYLYFIISSTDKEMILLEQAALAYYLTENGYNHTTLPVPTVDNRWFVEKENKTYLVLRVKDIQDRTEVSHGKALANFHAKSSSYNYEPQEISSYGQWKELWIKKLTAFETKINKEAETNQTEYYRLLMDMLPYIIGLAENAIQYLQESEKEKRYHYGDQGVFAFRRYQDNLLGHVIWADDLVYDHPTRDIAEFIRYRLLSENESVMDDVRSFITDYQMDRPLSIFSWRLLYARLIFPIHFFDYIEEGFQEDNFEQRSSGLEQLMNKQVVFEKRLGRFFEEINLNYESYQIPILTWLS